jgi:ribosomal protein S18 acetylase RimI-like enzyme
MFRTQPNVPARAGPTPPWVVRPARAGDAEGWHGLQRSIYREGVAFVGDGPPSVATLAGRLRARVPDASHVAFAEHARGDLVGWIEAHRMTPRRLAHVAWLTVAVAPGWRRQGVGAALMNEARGWAVARRVRKLQLHVRAGNAAALALYRRLGYEVEGVLRDQVAVGDLDGPSPAYEDEWVMALRLPPGPT